MTQLHLKSKIRKSILIGRDKKLGRAGCFGLGEICWVIFVSLDTLAINIRVFTRIMIDATPIICI